MNNPLPFDAEAHEACMAYDAELKCWGYTQPLVGGRLIVTDRMRPSPPPSPGNMKGKTITYEQFYADSKEQASLFVRHRAMRVAFAVMQISAIERANRGKS